MKKFFFFASVVLLSSIGFSASVTWSASGFSATSGTAYLVQYVGGSQAPTTESIVNAISTNGLTYSGSDFALVGSNSNVSGTAGFTKALAEYDVTNLNNYFVVVVSDDLTMVDVSQYKQMLDIPQASGGYTYDITFGKLGTTWTTGAVGVPEPTVMALLALGVAGLAIRRKVA